MSLTHSLAGVAGALYHLCVNDLKIFLNHHMHCASATQA